jgi:outer membrane biosynthesis protein TonB
MIPSIIRTRVFAFAASPARLGILIFLSALVLSLAALAQSAATAPQAAPGPSPDSQPAAQQPPAAQSTQPLPEPAPAQPPAATPDTQAEPAPAQPPAATPSGAAQQAEPGVITEEELRRLLVGKELFLRGGYLDNTLSFNEHGALIGHSPQGSYTLNGIQINKVRLAKHKVELEGDRYALHFLGALPYEDPTKAVDRVKITPKKKFVRITIDRELVVKPQEKKEKGKPAGTAPKSASPAPPPAAPTAAAPSEPAQPEQPEQVSEAGEAQTEIAAAPPAERPADSKSVTTTTSPAHANKVLKDALDNIFAQGFDTRMMASMPGFWKLYYEAAAEKTDYRPKDPAVLRQNMVDQKARLVSTFEPASNQFAQDYGVAGMCSYHVVIGADGKPGEIAVARPIGFGLDESAVDSIRKATFEPAIYNDKPVPVMLDLIFQFRIYSKRTDRPGEPQTPGKPAEPSLPGPYSVQQPGPDSAPQ